MVSQLVQGLIFALMISAFSLRAGLLTRAGAIAQFVLGWVVLGLGGWEWTIPILVFFFTSSVLSLIAERRRKGIVLLFEKGSKRDAAQVLANGGIAGLLVIGNYCVPSPFWYVGFLGSIAAAAADTWGTELGTIAHCQTRLISTFRVVEAGRSGGISVPGTFGGMMGAIVVTLSALVWLPGNVAASLAYVAGGGLAGSFIDSVLGATVQSQHRCNVCGRITERRSHCGSPTAFYSGQPWIANDLVNFVCTVSGGGLSVGIRWLLG